MKDELEKLKEESSSKLFQNTTEAPDAGIIAIESEVTTLTQAKFIVESQKDADSDLQILANYEKFVVRCYLDCVEMVLR